MVFQPQFCCQTNVWFYNESQRHRAVYCSNDNLLLLLSEQQGRKGGGVLPDDCMTTLVGPSGCADKSASLSVTPVRTTIKLDYRNETISYKKTKQTTTMIDSAGLSSSTFERTSLFQPNNKQNDTKVLAVSSMFLVANLCLISTLNIVRQPLCRAQFSF